MSHTVSRRSFIVGAGALGAGLAAGLAGCSGPKSKAEDKAAAGRSATDGPAFLNTPEPISDISDTLEADVVVVGLGVAGVSATRSAAESGLKVLAFERCPEPSARSSQFATFNTDTAQKNGY